jgi:hypothetical protein
MCDDISSLTRTVAKEDRFGRTNVAWLVDRQAKDFRVHCNLFAFLKGRISVR